MDAHGPTACAPHARTTSGVPDPVVLPDPLPGSAAAELRPLFDLYFPDGPPLRVVFWDGSSLGGERPEGRLRVRSAHALRRMVWSPGELGLGRAFVTGEIDIDGDIIAVLALLESAATSVGLSPRGLVTAARAARRAGVLGTPPPPLIEEAHPRGRLHTPQRDAVSVRHHYDVGNEFYRLVLGPTMAYSCARFTAPGSTLEAAQLAKFELICRKLGLADRPGSSLLDVGCGWGSLALHAAQHHGARVVGISVSREQVEWARRRVRDAGLEDRVDIRLQDYRDLDGERFDAISSVGMFEHVGARRIADYFGGLRASLAPRGRLLNHAISAVGGSRFTRRTFVGRYVFPDGELIDVGDVVLAMERCGFEVRDVESLREHYVDTLTAWVSNLEGSWSRAVQLVGPARARVWRLYMAASAVGFANGGIAVHQTLGVVPDEDGCSGMPRTRSGID
jgi:cyclopropane-fatty-acyl-phospholipid synthase